MHSSLAMLTIGDLLYLINILLPQTSEFSACVYLMTSAGSDFDLIITALGNICCFLEFRIVRFRAAKAEVPAFFSTTENSCMLGKVCSP